MDPLAVYLAMGEALAHMRAGKGPTMIEADTYRFFHQNRSFPGSAFGYRTKEEERQWRQRDPIERVAGHLVRGHRDPVQRRGDRQPRQGADGRDR